jgi:hypothetical protein
MGILEKAAKTAKAARQIPQGLAKNTDAIVSRKIVIPGLRPDSIIENVMTIWLYHVYYTLKLRKDYLLAPLEALLCLRISYITDIT